MNVGSLPKPKKSLRILLVLWFLLFSIVPLAFITGYSIVKFERAIDQELSQRLKGNAREIGVILNDFESSLVNEISTHSADSAFVYNVSSGNLARAREQVSRWLRNSLAQRMLVFNRQGRLDISFYRNAKGDVSRERYVEEGHFYLRDEDLKALDGKDELVSVNIPEKKTESRFNDSRLELVVFRKIKSTSGLVVGYLEESITMDFSFLSSLKNRMNVEVFFFDSKREAIVSSHEDLATYPVSFFNRFRSDAEFDYFDVNVRSVPFRLMLSSLRWGETNIVLGLGASKSSAKAVLRNVNYAFFTVVLGVIALLVALSFVTSRVLLKPIYQVLGAIRAWDFESKPSPMPQTNDTELGLLSESFNELAQRVYGAQGQLKEKIRELENANQEIRETQAKLVHAAKMASLGQLVAGVAHELNNPIGFIYSNMGHLRDYSNKLIELLETAEKRPSALPKAKIESDLDFILRDLPKLIASCEEGARRTRDIVIGLRNFSRLEEGSLKEFDLHDGIENTLSLLQGELKNRIKVHREFGNIPKVWCNPSQINQVFMNILSNGTQAIEGNGEIHIETRMKDNKTVEIAIADSGKGMTKEVQEQIFDPFFTTKGIGSGTGLGLSISFGIVQRHGGDIQVESKVGSGTRFLVSLPIGVAPKVDHLRMEDL